jgi:CopG family transcriptional regulator / antitoxin EndoAI
MERQTVQWTISIPPTLSKEASRVAKEEYRTRSELVREALRRYLENRSVDLIRDKISDRLKAMGIKNERDIERLMDEDR